MNAKTCFGSDSMTTSSREEGYKTCSWLWLRGLPGLSTITLRAKARAAEWSTLTKKSLNSSDLCDKIAYRISAINRLDLHFFSIIPFRQNLMGNFFNLNLKDTFFVLT